MRAATDWRRRGVDLVVWPLSGSLAVVWAWVPSVAALTTDGADAGSYEPYNTVRYVLLATMLSMMPPPAALAGYMLAMRRGRSCWRAAGLSQATCGTVAVLCVALVA